MYRNCHIQALLGVVMILAMVCFPGCASYPGIRPFKTDGCSACPDGNWGDYCEAHDIPYWKGGTAAERWSADVALFRGVRERTNWLWASVMFVGVRVGGFPYWPLPWRWGFGWDYAKGYGARTPEEQRLIDEEWELFIRSGQRRR